MRMGQLKVLVVDDHAGVRTGIASLVDAEQPRMACVGGAGTVREALALTRELQPDVIVLDVLLGMDDGLALIGPLKRAAPCAVMVLTSLSDPAIAQQAARLGAYACLHKAAPAAELIAAIDALRAQERELLPLNAAGALSWPAGSKHP